MASIVYALFPSRAAADAADVELRRGGDPRTPRTVQLFTRAPLDGNILPDHATEYGRNLLVAMIAGAVFMATAGGIAGALDLMLGMGVGLGIVLGLLTGLLMGLVGAMQAGTRIPKQPLREVQARIGEGAVLLVLEVERHEVGGVLEVIDRHAALLVDTLGGW